ncbi:dienelactone hydrolase family protein [Streptomyces sp. NPDC002143]
MDTVVRIEPRRDEVMLSGGAHPVAAIRLGGVPRGAVLVLCAPGALERDAADLMNGLAEHGYESVAADLSVEGGRVGESAEALSHDLGVLLGLLADRGWNHEEIGVIGYELGGSAAFHAASSFTLGAAVSVSPTGPATGTTWSEVSERVGPLRTPWLGLFGEQDLPHPSMGELQEQLDTASDVFVELIGYDGVGRLFYRDAPQARLHAAAFDAWQRALEWLESRVAPRPTPGLRAWRAKRSAGCGTTTMKRS